MQPVQESEVGGPVLSKREKIAELIALPIYYI